MLSIALDQPDMMAKLPVKVAWCTECAACETRMPQSWARPTSQGTSRDEGERGQRDKERQKQRERERERERERKRGREGERERGRERIKK